MTETESKASLKEVSVKGVRSSNAFRQNLRRAKNKAKTSREKRTQTKRRTRTKIRLTLKDTHHGKGRTKIKSSQPKPPQPKLSQTKKRSILKPQKGKTLKRHRKVRWKDQETGSSLVSYNRNEGEFTSRESPLFRNQRPLRMRFTQKRRRRDDDDTSRETNIVVRWKIHDEPKEDDILSDAVAIDDMNVEEASKRLREVGIETDRKAPVDLIKNLAILSHGLDNGAIQTRG